MAKSYIARVRLMARPSSKAYVPMACDVAHCRVTGIAPDWLLCSQLLRQTRPRKAAVWEICVAKLYCATEQLWMHRSPGPIQFHGPTADRANFTLSLELCQGRAIEIA